MSQFFRLHPDNPQPRLIKQAAQIINDGGVVALPTDSSYALACHLDDKNAVERLRRIRGLDERQLLSLLVRDLSELANFAMVDNRQFRLIKSVTPGPYVFVLEATKEVPRRLSHPSRKTIGLRVPDHAITLAILEELGQPLLGTTLIMPGETQPLNDAEEIRPRDRRRPLSMRAVDYRRSDGSRTGAGAGRARQSRAFWSRTAGMRASVLACMSESGQTHAMALLQ
jgi:tRNA threonylcarbamoyl adenosine modification protein (Sua5/YciO/YrdC/YwlC family)